MTVCVVIKMQDYIVFAADSAEEICQNNEGLLVDVVVVIALSADARDSAIKLVEKGGTLHLGAPLAPGTSWTRDGADADFDEIMVTSKFSVDHKDTYQYFRLLKFGRVQPERLISHRFGIEGAPAAFRMLVEAQEYRKIIVHPGYRDSGSG